MKRKIKSGDEVVVISGAHKGGRGKILQIISSKERVIVEGVNIRKRIRKPKSGDDNAERGMEEREGTIHYSNVMLADRFDTRASSKTN